MLAQGWAQVCFLTGETPCMKRVYLNRKHVQVKFYMKEMEKRFLHLHVESGGQLARFCLFHLPYNTVCLWGRDEDRSKTTIEMCQLNLTAGSVRLVSECEHCRDFFVFMPVSIQNKLLSSYVYFLATFWCPLHWAVYVDFAQTYLLRKSMLCFGLMCSAVLEYRYVLSWVQRE